MSAKGWRAWTTKELDVMRANGHLGVDAVHDALLRECGTDRSARSIESQASRACACSRCAPNAASSACA